MRERLFGADHALVAQSLHNLGHCLYYANRYAEAVARLEKALSIRERVYPPAHPLVDSTLEGLSQALDTVGRYEASLEATRRLKRVREERLSAGHPRIAICDARIASLLVSLGRPAEAPDAFERALPLYLRALKIKQEVFREANETVARGLMSVALCHAQLKRYEDALPYARAAAEATRASGSPYHYESKLAAFTAARRAHRDRRPHPYFWGPFVYIGDPR